MIGFDKVVADADIVISKAADFPGELKDRIFGERKPGKHKKFDVYTPLLQGKKWLYEDLQKYQPKTASILLNGSDLLIVGHEVSSGYNLHLLQNINGFTVEVHRAFYGRNPIDESFSSGRRPMERFNSLPDPVKYAYFWRFDGLSIPSSTSFGINTRLLPFPINRPWQSIDNYLSSLRMKKQYLPLIEELIPEVKPDEKGDTYTKFMMFLDSRRSLSGKEGDVFFVKNHIQDAVIYHIGNADVENMNVLSSPSEAIDSYCAHVLSGSTDRFDFSPYLTSLKAEGSSL